MAGLRIRRPVAAVPRLRLSSRAAVDRALRGFALLYLAAIFVAVVVWKAAFMRVISVDPVFSVYGCVVCVYVLSRLVISLFYRPQPMRGYRPPVALVMPAFNEEDAVADSIRAVLAQDYPADRLEVVVVDDGSTDTTGAHIDEVAGDNPRVRVIHFPVNRGKRAAMAAGVRATSAEFCVFVDSDSVLEPDGVERLVQGFADPRVGAIAGYADVLNAGETWLTRMQAVRYFVAFKVLKAAESVFGTVTCCSGCFAAYRRSAILPHMDRWEHQRFLGVPSTYGDDRALTNAVLRNWRVIYEDRAVSHTLAPSSLRVFLVQQARWKRSWSRESLLNSRFVWRKHPVAAASIYSANVLPVLAPLIAARALVWHPLVTHSGGPLLYLLGVYVMALLYGLYYVVRQRSYGALWIWGVGFVFFYLAVLLWQTWYAIATIRRTTWGTRPATHALVAEAPA